MNFVRAKAILNIHGETHLTFTITEKDGNVEDITETVEIKITEIRPWLFMVTWKEVNGNTISQIQDY